MQRIPMTPEGYRIARDELKHAREVLRPEVVQAIEEARAHGDISENAEFEAAKERQAHLEGRIRELEARLAKAEVIDVTRLPRSDRVVFGSTVTLLDLATEEESRVRIVGQEETDARAGLISPTSPIGQALLGRSEGEEVKVYTPRGERSFEIVRVEYV
ncbi:MAG: transcription elongation factor GreA [Deltaproteobacteria bacterium]|nr:transcription elongation factor GreA [Deltaproteobacteria bacterium]